MSLLRKVRTGVTSFGGAVITYHGCPFCLESGKVTTIAETEGAYLCEVRDSPIVGCHFIIPKEHISFVEDLPGNWMEELTALLPKVPWWSSTADYNVSINQGHDAGQRVGHLHWWIIPREDEDPYSPAYQLGPATAIAKLHRLV